MKALNIYNFVAKDKFTLEDHPHFGGAFHDPEGYYVATDAYSMIVFKKDVNEEQAGKIVMKNGSIVECRFPDWRRIMGEQKNPSYWQEQHNGIYEDVSLNVSRLQKALEAHKQIPEKNLKDYTLIRIGNITLKPRYIKQICDILQVYPDATVQINKHYIYISGDNLSFLAISYLTPGAIHDIIDSKAI